MSERVRKRVKEKVRQLDRETERINYVQYALCAARSYLRHFPGDDSLGQSLLAESLDKRHRVRVDDDQLLETGVDEAVLHRMVDQRAKGVVVAVYAEAADRL